MQKNATGWINPERYWRRVRRKCKFFFQVKLYLGFQEEPDIRRALQLCSKESLSIDPINLVFFLGTERIAFRRRSPFAKWRRTLFQFLSHSASSAIEFFKIPVEQVVEIGIRIEL